MEQLSQGSTDIKERVEDLLVCVDLLLFGITEVKMVLEVRTILVLVICTSSERKHFIGIVVYLSTVINF